MARYCSAQDNVRTRQSPPYRETIRVNVLHGRKSMSWAKSVLPLFTGTSSETFRKVPDRVQIDTTLNRQNRVQNHPFIGRHRLLNRTAVAEDLISVAIHARRLIENTGQKSRFNKIEIVFPSRPMLSSGGLHAAARTVGRSGLLRRPGSDILHSFRDRP